MSILTAPVHPVDHIDAGNAFEAAVKADQFFALAWAKLAQCRSRGFSRVAADSDAQAAKASAALDTAVRLAPEAPETILAEAYFQFNVRADYAAAKVTLERLRQRSSDSEVLLQLALLARQSGAWSEAVRMFEASLAGDPCNFEILREAGATNMALRRFTPALNLLDRCLKLDPKNMAVLIQKMYLYQATGNLQAADKILDLLPIDIDDERTVQANFDHLILRRNFNEAKKMMDDIYKALPDDKKYGGGLKETTYRMLLGLAEKYAGSNSSASYDLTSALGILKSYQRAEPKSAEYAKLISQACTALGQKDDALEAAMRAARTSAKWEDHYNGPAYEINLARVQAQFGENDQAVSALERLIQLPANWNPPLTRQTLFIDPVWDGLRGDSRFQELCLGKSADESGK
jgi:tetratricopeptide (TPR) repeat protein